MGQTDAVFCAFISLEMFVPRICELFQGLRDFETVFFVFLRYHHFVSPIIVEAVVGTFLKRLMFLIR